MHPTVRGSALYLPKRIYEGEDLDEDSLQTLINNKDQIDSALNKPAIEALNDLAKNKDVLDIFIDSHKKVIPTKYQGTGVADFLGKVFNWISTNKDTINNVANVTGTVGNTVAGLTNNTLDVIRKIKELRQQAITNEDLNKVIGTSEKNGSGFFYISS